MCAAVRISPADRAGVALVLCAILILLCPFVESTAQARTIEIGEERYPTLAAAIAAVPKLRDEMRDGESLELLLPSGVMRLHDAVIIPRAASGKAGPLVIRGARDGTTVLTGAIVVTARPATVRDAPGTIVPAGTMVLDLGDMPGPIALDRRGPHAALSSSVQVFQGRRWLQPSRWPATGYATAGASGANKTGPIIALPMDVAARWRSEPALWAAGYWGADWEYERVPVAAVTKDGLRLAPLQAQQPVRSAVRFRVENAVSQLASGNIVSLPTSHRVLVIPIPGAGKFEVAIAPTLMRIDGATHVTIADMAIERSRGDAIVVDGSTDVTISNCHVRDIGGNGIMVIGGEGVTIRDTVVSRVGERGVVLGGGDRQALHPARHSFIDGLVSDFGRLSPSYRPGIDLWGVGNRVSGSLISGGDHAGIVVSGNDHQLIDNEISNVLRDTEDAGAIYGGRDWTMRGLAVTGNYIHDLGDPARNTMFLSGVYLDDQWSGAQVTGNVIGGGDYGVVIGGGRDNLVASNWLVTPRRGGVYVDARGLESQAAMLDTFRHSLAAMPVRSAIWSGRYPTLAALTVAQQGVPDGNVVRDNAMLGADTPILVGPADAQRRVIVRDNRSCNVATTCRPPSQIVRRRVPRLQEKLQAWLQ